MYLDYNAKTLKKGGVKHNLLMLDKSLFSVIGLLQLQRFWLLKLKSSEAN